MTETEIKGEVLVARREAVFPETEAGRAVVTMDPMRLISKAIDRGLGPDDLDKLMALQERWEANEERKAYTAAMAAFKAENIDVRKTAEVKYGQTHYFHADLGKVMAIVNPLLGKHELSLDWDAGMDDEALVWVSCRVTHAAGHRSAPVTLKAPLDNTGQKNVIQQQTSTISYLKRQTAFLVLGLQARDDDDDGRGMTAVVLIDDGQKAKIIDRLRETGLATSTFLQAMGSRSVDDVPADRFDEAIERLAAYEAKKAEKAQPDKAEAGEKPDEDL